MKKDFFHDALSKSYAILKKNNFIKNILVATSGNETRELEIVITRSGNVYTGSNFLIFIMLPVPGTYEFKVLKKQEVTKNGNGTACFAIDWTDLYWRQRRLKGYI